MNEKYRPLTNLVWDGIHGKQMHGAVVPPIFQTSLFTFDDWDDIENAFEHRLERYIYSRQNNPVTELVESKIAAITGGDMARLFPSGMSAITSAMLHFLNYGDHVVAVKNIYGPARNLLDDYLSKKLNIETTYVPGNDAGEFERSIRPATRLFYLESPSSAIFSLQDLKAVSALAKERGIHTFIDNSWATPVFQNPLKMGIDMEMHSCSKYLGGHSDLVSGVLIGSKMDMESIRLRESELLGPKMAPFESWLLLRSLRTLWIRMKAHQESAMQIAQYLDQHPKVKTVRFPGLPAFDQYELGRKQLNGYSGLMSFELDTKNLAKIKIFVNAFRLFRIGVSWGGHESLIYAPAISYSKEMNPEQFQSLGISLSDIRISVGLEDSGDLLNDLDQAFAKI